MGIVKATTAVISTLIKISNNEKLIRLRLPQLHQPKAGNTNGARKVIADYDFT